MADPTQPSDRAVQAAQYLRMVGATRRRRRPAPVEPEPPVIEIDTIDPIDVSEAEPEIDYAEAFRQGPMGMGPESEDVVIEPEEPGIETWAEAFRGSRGIAQDSADELELERSRSDLARQRRRLDAEEAAENILGRDAGQFDLERPEQLRQDMIARARQYDDRRVAESFMTPEEIAADRGREHATPVTSAVRELGQAATWGHMPEIMATGDTIGGVFTGETPIDSIDGLTGAYRGNFDRWEDAYRHAAEDNPHWSMLGDAAALYLSLRPPMGAATTGPWMRGGAEGARSTGGLLGFIRGGGASGAMGRYIGAGEGALGRIRRAGGMGVVNGALYGEGTSPAPLFSPETGLRTLGGAVGGGIAGTTLGAASEGLGALGRGIGAGRAFRDAQDELSARSRRILEGNDPLPDFSGTPIDDLDLEDALAASDDAMTIATPANGNSATPEAEGMSIRSLVTEPLRADPNVQRLRSAGLVTIPQARAVSRQPGGIEAFADDLDRAGVSQRGEILQTDTGVARAQRLRDRALAQRQRVLREAEELGVAVSPQDLAQALRRRAIQARRTVGPTGRANGAYIDQIASEIESLPTLIAMEDEIAAAGAQSSAYLDELTGIARAAREGVGPARNLLSARVQQLLGENATPAERELGQQLAFFLDESASYPIGLADLEAQIQDFTRQARFDRNRGEAVLSPQIQTARGIRGEMTAARLQALEAANAELARQFRNAQRGYQIGATLVPQDAASRAQLGEMNRNLSMSDMQAGIAGSAAGGPIGGIALAAANRGYRRIEPSLFATINEGAILRARASQGQLSPSAARMLEYLQRSPSALGRSGQLLIAAEARGPAAIEATFRALVGNDAAMRAAAQDLDDQADDAEINPWADDGDSPAEEQINPWAD